MTNPNYILSEEWEPPLHLIEIGEAIDYYIENTKVDKRKKEYLLFKERINEMVAAYNKITTPKYGFKKI